MEAVIGLTLGLLVVLLFIATKRRDDRERAEFLARSMRHHMELAGEDRYDVEVRDRQVMVTKKAECTCPEPLFLGAHWDDCPVVRR